MIQIEKTAVYDTYQELGKIYSHLNSLSIEKIKGAKTKDDLIIAKGHLEYHEIRIIVISAVSFFEQKIYEIIKETYKTNKNPTLTPFINNITKRRYHQLFRFDSSNINSFYSLFGEEFKEWSQKKEAKDDMSEFVKNFILLNKLRNKLAHEGYNHNIKYSSEHLYRIFEESCKMLNWLSESLKEFEENQK